VTPLYAGHDPGSSVVGRIEPGDYVSFTHVPAGSGTYVTTNEPGWGPLKSGGWLLTSSEGLCADYAG
jgi:hypothetical protein